MKYYLIDASALVYGIRNLGNTKTDFFIEQATKRALLYVPQFCVAEVLNAFARVFYKDQSVGEETYIEWRDVFIKAIHNRRILYCYDLHRYHNLNTDKVFEIEHTTSYNPKRKNYLSALDILIIAMGMELRRIHPPDDVSVLTRDGRLHKISNASEEFAHATWFD